MRTRIAVFALFVTLIASSFGTRGAGASIAPTTPTFLLKWGNAGAAPGQLTGPWGVTTDALGNVYVVDSGNNRVQKFDRLGNFILQWGSGGSGNGQLSTPTYAVVAPNGDVYISDTFNHRIQRFTSTGAYLGQFGGNGSGDGQFSIPLGVAVDRSGNVYVADAGNHRIQKFSETGAYLAKWGGFGSGNGQFNNPQDIGLSPAGDVYVTDYFNHRVQKFSSTGVYLTQWGSFFEPDGMGVDAAGNVYVSDGADRVQKFKGDGTYLTQWGSGGSSDGQFNNPIDLTVDAAGNVYVADYNNNRVQKFSAAGAALSMAPAKFLLGWGANGSGNGQFITPAEMAFDAAGNVYVVDSDNNRIQKFTASGAYLTQWGGYGNGNGQFYNPIGIATDAAGNVYVSDYSNSRIQKFTSNGVYVTKWGSFGAGNGQFNGPRGLATDAAGNVYAADFLNSRIQKFDSNGGYLGQVGTPGSGNGQLDGPADVAVDAVGNLYVADLYNNRIQKFSAAGVYLTQWGGQGSGSGQFEEPSGLAIDATGNIHVADAFNNRIQEFTANGTWLTQWGELGNGNDQLNYPAALAIDAGGNIYVTDQENHRIRKFVTPPAIALVSDVGNDQGKQALLRVLRGSADSPGAGVTITGYEVYRRNDPLPAGASQSAEPMAAQLAGWTYVTSFPAHGESEYNVVAPTLANANASSLYYSALMVRAVTADPFTFYDSATENGFSVDNLSPPAPSQLLAMYASGATNLQWDESTASDFSSFRVYRGSSASFEPGPASLVAETTETGYVDPGAAGSYYKVSAVDMDGNESAFALTGPNQTTDVPAAPAVAFALDGTRPNPATGGRLMVHFALPTGEAATLELLDVAGRRVTERTVGTLGAGRHSVELGGGRSLTPGLYFVRLTQGANQRIVRTTVLN